MRWAGEAREGWRMTGRDGGTGEGRMRSKKNGGGLRGTEEAAEETKRQEKDRCGLRWPEKV